MNRSISVIIPSYNCAEFVGEAILSVLGQSLPPRELIVIDDGSTDDTAGVVGGFGARVRLVRQSNQGVAVARNRGIGLARGDWLLFLDADDRLRPCAIESLVRGAQGRSDCVVYGDRLDIDAEGRFLATVRHRDCAGPVPNAARATFGGAPFPPGAAIVPRALAERIGGFDQRFEPCEDRHFWFRCGCLARFAHVPTTVLEYRDRPGSHSKNRPRQVSRSVLTRIELLGWCRERGIDLFEDDPAPATILGRDLVDVYWRREWDAVDALLELARDIRIDGDEIASIRRARHRAPAWLIRAKDWVDRRMRVDGRPVATEA